jgi:hypothetical protein
MIVAVRGQGCALEGFIHRATMKSPQRNAQ